MPLENYRWLFSVTFILSTLTWLTACERTLFGVEKASILVYSETAVDKLFAGLNANDYVMFSSDFDSDMQSEISITNFATWKDHMDHYFGKYLSRKVEKVTQADEFRVVYYQAEFDKTGQVIVTVAFHGKEPHRIVFLSFDSENASWSTFQ